MNSLSKERPVAARNPMTAFLAGTHPPACIHWNVPATVLQTEQARLLYARIPELLVVNALIAAILVAVQRSVLSPAPVVVWCVLFLATLVLRAAFAAGYRRASATTAAGGAWLTRFRIGAAATGTAWGLTSVLLFPGGDIPHQTFLAFAIAGMTAGAVASLSVDLVAALAFITPALAALIARLIAEGGNVQLAMGFMATLYLLALTLTARRTYLSSCETICLQFAAVARENTLRNSEAQLIKAQEVAQTGSWSLDIPHNRLTWSQQVYRIFGIPPQTSLTYETFLTYVHPEDREKVGTAWSAALHGAPYDIEHRIFVNGETRWVRERAQIEFDAEARPLAGIGTVQDITERKKSEDKLRLHSQILENLSEGIFLIRASDATIVFANPQFERLFRYGPGELIGKHVSVVNAPNERSPEEVADAINHQLEQRGVWSGEIHNVKKDGTPFWCHASISTFDHPDFGKVWVSIHEDITERKKAEEELRIAAIAFESQEGIIVTDAKGVIMRVNQAFTRLTGYSPEEAVGKTPSLLTSGRHGKEFYEEMWTTLKQKKHWHGEIWNRRKNGKVYAEWLTISAVTSPDGNTTHYVGAFSNITNDPEASAEIHRLAYYDPLTHLPNRRLLMDRLGQALATSQRSGRYGALLFMDLDNFKKLNDTRGHEVGDLLLVEIAKRLNACVREGDTVVRLGDTVVRLGGDEFVLMLEDLGSNPHEAAIQAGHVGNKVREAIASPYLLNGMDYSCTASIGISLFLGHNETVDNLLRQADLAMYHAKKSGRNNVSFFDPVMQSTLLEHSELENDLRYALEGKQLHLYYQLQIDSERRVAGAEALLRWRHPKRGLINPDKFIPLAEETGLIIPIGLWVLQTACAQLKVWSTNPATRDLQLAINVSVRQFHQPDFVQQVEQALAATGIDPGRLKIELTESLVLNDVSDTITKMRALKALGVALSMDDFGTGYSSLSNLQKLPLNQLKIDQSFVRDLATNPNDAAIVQAIITMGLAFDLNVIAEGVENDVQREFLSLLGCHAFQGFLFNKPMPAGEFETLMAQYA